MALFSRLTSVLAALILYALTFYMVLALGYDDDEAVTVEGYGYSTDDRLL